MPPSNSFIISPFNNWVDFSLSLPRLIDDTITDRSIIFICTTKRLFTARRLTNKHSFRSSTHTREPITTLRNISKMHNTEVYFTSNVPLLRAHISTIVATPGGGGGVLAVWMFGSCHKWTINFSAQGFGRTAAALVDAGHRANLTVVLGDGEAAWLSHKLPLLNSSVPIGELKDMLVDRRLSLRQVLTRWFKIVEPDVEARVGGRGDAEKGAAVGEADGNASVDEEETDEEADVTTDATNNAAVEAMKTHNAADTAAGEADGNAVADEEAAVEAMEIDKAAGIPAAAEVDVDMDAMDIYTGGELQIPRSP